MTPRSIYITQFDKKRLLELFDVATEFGGEDRDDLARLSVEVKRATEVPSRDVPPDVVTMNSKVRLRDLDSEEEMVYTLVFPMEAHAAGGAISVLAPVGTALLGYSAGEEIEWPVPDGVRRIRIEEILYQPEAAGDYHL